MTQEDKELLLKDLCARLPYGVKVNVNGEIQTFDSLCDDDGYRFQFLQSDGITEGVNIENIKPYLRPMSSMTEKEEKEFALLQTEAGNSGFLYPSNAANLMKFLYRHHLDYNGLIEKGLAIAVTEENNPYKNFG